jgi:SAM-dependent methyltransferase
VHHGPLEAAGYPDAHFDLTVSLEVLEHLPAPVPHLREVARITRAGGLLLLTTPNFAGLSRRRFGLGWRVIDPEHLGYFTRSTLGRALGDAGFSQASIRSRSLDVLSWRRRAPHAAAPAFDPQASAELRDAVAARPVLRLARDAMQGVLWLTGLGDSLLAWARR